MSLLKHKKNNNSRIEGYFLLVLLIVDLDVNILRGKTCCCSSDEEVAKYHVGMMVALIQGRSNLYF